MVDGAWRPWLNESVGHWEVGHYQYQCHVSGDLGSIALEIGVGDWIIRKYGTNENNLVLGDSQP